MQIQFLATVELFFYAVEGLQFLGGFFFLIYSFALVVCHVHTSSLGWELSTIVEGQRLVRHQHVREHRHVHIHTCTCTYTCACCGAESCRVSRVVVGWVGGLVWCGDFVVTNCVLVVLSSCCHRFVVWCSLSKKCFRMISILQRARAERSMIELAIFSKWLGSRGYL